MVVEEAISDAEYFLKAVKRSKSREDLRPNLGAFLAMSRSIVDHLLEDYNIKFGLNINLETKLKSDTFENEARKQSNLSALEFIMFYKERFQELEKNDIFKLLKNKRNLRIHRRITTVRGEFIRRVSDTVGVSDRGVNVIVTRKNGNIEYYSNDKSKQEGRSPTLKQYEQLEKEQGPIDSAVNWYFSDYYKEDLVDLCQDFLDTINNFVHNIQTNFP
jgi:hypothetical protein